MTKLENIRRHYGFDIDAFFHISLKNKYLYVQTPKVASTTLKQKLISIEVQGSRIAPSSVGLHPDILQSVHVKPYQLPDDLLSEVLFGREFKRFCFVRSPEVRVLSAYLDKICGFEAEGIVFRRKMGIAEDAEVPFDVFLGALSDTANNVRSWDQHWRPQFALLRPDLIAYDLIGHLEKFDEDYALLDGMLGGILGSYERRSPHQTDAQSKVDQWITSEHRTALNRLYANDFRYFKYDNAESIP